MYQDGTLRIEERQGFLDAATRFQQSICLVGNTDIETKIMVGLKIIDNLLGEMMNVDHQALIAGCSQFHDDMPKQRLPTYLYKCFRHRVCQGFKPRSEPCSKYHRLFHHYPERSVDSWIRTNDPHHVKVIL